MYVRKMKCVAKMHLESSNQTKNIPMVQTSLVQIGQRVRDLKSDIQKTMREITTLYI